MKGVIIHPYQTLVNYDAVYQSPISTTGEFLGPLVGYAGTYTDDQGEKKNYVGSAYFNMAKVEEDPDTKFFFADDLADKLIATNIKPQVLIGAPMGGIIFASAIADILDKRTAFFEKKDTGLVFNRHTLNKRDKVVLVEDVCNNFSTTDKMIKIIIDMGAKVKAIVCIFNRSSHDTWKGIPVISVIHKHTPEYKQDDPKVKKLIDDCNIVWKPKEEWPFLKKVMEDAEKKKQKFK